MLAEIEELTRDSDAFSRDKRRLRAGSGRSQNRGLRSATARNADPGRGEPGGGAPPALYRLPGQAPAEELAAQTASTAVPLGPAALADRVPRLPQACRTPSISRLMVTFSLTATPPGTPGIGPSKLTPKSEQVDLGPSAENPMRVPP